MLTEVRISNEYRNHRDQDILDVVEHLGKGECGSAPNALAVMVRQSPLFKATLAKLRQESVPEPRGQPVAEDEMGKPSEV